MNQHHSSHATPARAFVRIAVAAAVVIWFIVPARAATFAAGPVTSPAGFPLGDEDPLAPLADTFTFQSGADYPPVFGDFLGASLPMVSSYAGTIDTGMTSPVPEPQPGTLLPTGAVLLAWHLYRRRMDQRNERR